MTRSKTDLVELMCADRLVQIKRQIEQAAVDLQGRRGNCPPRSGSSEHRDRGRMTNRIEARNEIVRRVRERIDMVVTRTERVEIPSAFGPLKVSKAAHMRGVGILSATNEGGHCWSRSIGSMKPACGALPMKVSIPRQSRGLI
jgi:hypothetical protein